MILCFQVFPGSSAEGQLTRGEAILAVDGVEAATLTHLQALELITRAGTELTLTIDPRRATTNRSVRPDRKSCKCHMGMPRVLHPNVYSCV